MILFIYFGRNLRAQNGSLAPSEAQRAEPGDGPQPPHLQARRDTGTDVGTRGLRFPRMHAQSRGKRINRKKKKKKPSRFLGYSPISPRKSGDVSPSPGGGSEGSLPAVPRRCAERSGPTSAPTGRARLWPWCCTAAAPRPRCLRAPGPACSAELRTAARLRSAPFPGGATPPASAVPQPEPGTGSRSPPAPRSGPGARSPELSNVIAPRRVRCLPLFYVLHV